MIPIYIEGMEFKKIEEGLDRSYEWVCKKVDESSSYLDDEISSYFGRNGEHNCSVAHKKPRQDSIRLKAHKADSFFQTPRFLLETESSFIRMRLSSFYDQAEGSDFGAKLSARIPFVKTKKHINIFLENITESNFKTLPTDKQKRDEDIGFGLNYFNGTKGRLEGKYSIGFYGIDPFFSARFSKNFESKYWSIEPTQTFIYSFAYGFEERSDIYFDRDIDDKALLRVHMSRGSKECRKGMDYGMDISYYRLMTSSGAIALSQSAYGNTEYVYRYNNCEEQEVAPKKFESISSYTTKLVWRQNIWRSWFFYELVGGVDFRKENEFEPNYSAGLKVDIFFGNVKKR